MTYCPIIKYTGLGSPPAPQRGEPGACWLRPGPSGRSSAPGPRARALAPAWPFGPLLRPARASAAGRWAAGAARHSGGGGWMVRQVSSPLPPAPRPRARGAPDAAPEGVSCASPGKRRRQRLRRLPGRARIEQNRLFCIIAGTPPGLCRMHSPVTPQLPRLPGPGSGGLKACGWWAGARPAMALPAYKTVIFCSIRAKDQTGPIRSQGAAAAQRRRAACRLYGPPLRRGWLGAAPARPPALASAWPFGPLLRPAGGAASPAACGGPAPHGDRQLRRPGPLWPILPHPGPLRQLGVDTRGRP